MQTLQSVVEQNQRAWNEVAGRHAEQNFAETKKSLNAEPGYYIDAVFRDHLLELGLSGKTMAQFNCNNGRELISAVQLGAEYGYGYDFSSEFVGQARMLAQSSGVGAQFVESNIYEIPDDYNQSADILFCTAGALCWLPDVERYLSVAHRVLRPGGHLVLYETHPFLEMFKTDRDRNEDEALLLHYPYFMTEPLAWDSGLDYYSNEKHGAQTVYWYHHTLSSIIQGSIDSGFAIRMFSEYSHDNSIGYRHAEKFPIRPPMSYILSCERI